MTSLIIDLAQMVDLALTPEMGQANFNVLRNFLHVLINCSNLNSYKVELQATEKNKYDKLVAKNGKSVSVMEYEYDESDIKKRTAVSKAQDSNANKIAVIVDTHKTGRAILNVTDASGAVEGVASTQDMRNLELKVNNLTDALSGVLPDGKSIIDYCKDGKNPFGEMFQMLNLSKRVEALEVAITKIIDLVNELAREHVNMENSIAPFHEPVKSKSSGKGDVSKRGSRTNQTDKEKQRHQGGKQDGEQDEMQRNMSVSSHSGARSSSIRGSYVIPSLPDIRSSESVIVQGAKMNLSKEIEKLKNDVKKLQEMSKHSQGFGQGSSGGGGGGGASEDCMDNLGVICREFEVENAQRRKNDIDTKFANLEGSMEAMEKRMVILVKDVENIKCTINENMEEFKSHVYDEDIFQCEANARISGLIKDISSLNAITNDLKMEVENNKKDMVDKNYLHELLEEKADFKLVQSKVSHIHFDETKQDLTNSLCEVYNALQTKEAKNDENFKVLNALLQEKFNTSDFNEFKAFAEDKLAKLQERIVKLALLSHEGEAAGTKLTYLRNVNCVSCDNRSVMKIFQECSPKPNMMPPDRSLKPFLAYELDNVRKEMLNSKTQRNMHHLESAMKADTLCKNLRYSGGEHTIKKVADCKFQKCWSIPAPTAGDHELRGLDGKLYKGQSAQKVMIPRMSQIKEP